MHRDFLHPQIYDFIQRKHGEARNSKKLSVVEENSSLFSIQDSPLGQRGIEKELEEKVETLEPDSKLLVSRKGTVDERRFSAMFSKDTSIKNKLPK